LEQEFLKDVIARPEGAGVTYAMTGSMRLGLEASLRPGGRPRKRPGEPPSPFGHFAEQD
jgi:hypothetical protein